MPSPDNRPDFLEYVVRFVCGAIVGGFLTFVAGVWLFFPGESIISSAFMLSVLGLGLVFGTLAATIGDEFWHSLSDWLRWFRWW